jgi:hypothetical protein
VLPVVGAQAAPDRMQTAIAVSHDIQRRDRLAELVHSPAPTPPWAVIRQDEREPGGLREPARRLVEPLDGEVDAGFGARKHDLDRQLPRCAEPLVCLGREVQEEQDGLLLVSDVDRTRPPAEDA